MKDRDYVRFEDKQLARGIDVAETKRKLAGLEIEPAGGFGDSGTRFKVFRARGAARTVREKLEDAAEVHRLTGACPSAAIHIPWDRADDYGARRREAESLGIRIGAVNPNLFQEDDYRLGSVTHADPAVRRRATAHLLECVEIARQTGSRDLSLWFADGTNYPGQGDLRKRKGWMLESLEQVYQALDPDMRLLIEYKFFEPGFYHTDLADWGMAHQLAVRLGPQAEVLVDTGHHAPGTNVEHIAAYLIDEGRLGGFHFNGRKYADDDLIAGSINPYELFLIFHQIVSASADSDPRIRSATERIAYMIDQSPNIEPKLEAAIRTVCNVQTQYAKALLVHADSLREAQESGDVLAAENAVREAFEFDVSPLLQAVREERGLPADPMAAYRAGDYRRRLEARAASGSAFQG